jgi:hypothetical protein
VRRDELKTHRSEVTPPLVEVIALSVSRDLDLSVYEVQREVTLKRLGVDRDWSHEGGEIFIRKANDREVMLIAH